MKLTDGEPIGILRGPSNHGGMDVVAPHLADPPARGDFALVPGRDGTLVLRIAGSFATGSFGESSDRGAEYLAQLALGDAEVPARIRELLLRFRIEVGHGYGPFFAAPGAVDVVVPEDEAPWVLESPLPSQVGDPRRQADGSWRVRIGIALNVGLELWARANGVEIVEVEG